MISDRAVFNFRPALEKVYDFYLNILENPKSSKHNIMAAGVALNQSSFLKSMIMDDAEKQMKFLQVILSGHVHKDIESQDIIFMLAMKYVKLARFNLFSLPVELVKDKYKERKEELKQQLSDARYQHMEIQKLLVKLCMNNMNDSPTNSNDQTLSLQKIKQNKHKTN